jgi:hypothetical protein
LFFFGRARDGNIEIRTSLADGLCVIIRVKAVDLEKKTEITSRRRGWGISFRCFLYETENRV